MFQLDVHNIVHDIDQRQSVLYALAKADTPFGPYQNEHALFLWFNESRTEIVKIEELFDTSVMKETLPKLDQYMKQQKELKHQERFLPEQLPVEA